MKDRRRRDSPLWCSAAASGKFRRPSSTANSFWSALCVILCCALLVATAFRLFAESFHPVLHSTLPNSPATNAVSADGHLSHPLSFRIRDAVSFPNQLVLFIEPHPPLPIPGLLCLYYPPSSPSPSLQLPPISYRNDLIRCPTAPRDFTVSLTAAPSSRLLPHQWDRLAYLAVLDPQDNATLVFLKGLNLRPARLSDPSRYQCLFGWDFSKPKYLLASKAVSVAQEIVRCKTPLSILHRQPHRHLNPVLVSVKYKYRGSTPLPSIARPEILPSMVQSKKNLMCVCTMVRNQARAIREWIAYHSRIGVERWFIYDNDSDDGLEDLVAPIDNVNLHRWPWAKTQEAGFAHCALRARDSCEWVGFIDVDEFLYLPGNATMHDVLANYSLSPWVGELRTSCYSFGPSGRKTVPANGVMVGYTCRMAAPERHKSIVRPEALNSSLINVVHHFHLKDGMRYVNMEKGVMVINHYKYQVWEVFKDKFYRRVATYVADWRDEENAGSKDRAPGLGTEAVEPSDWSRRFCDVNDTGLRNLVLREFIDRDTGLLPW